MDDEAAFLRAASAAPNDDAPWLVFADWLEERGRNRAAEILRQSLPQIHAMIQGGSQPEDVMALVAREGSLANAIQLARHEPIALPVSDPPTNEAATKDTHVESRPGTPLILWFIPPLVTALLLFLGNPMREKDDIKPFQPHQVKLNPPFNEFIAAEKERLNKAFAMNRASFESMRRKNEIKGPQFVLINKLPGPKVFIFVIDDRAIAIWWLPGRLSIPIIVPMKWLNAESSVLIVYDPK